MIQPILTYLNTRLLTTGYFTQLYELVETKQNPDKGRVPMHYCGKGEWKEVVNFDKHRGTSYWRITGNIPTVENTSTIVSNETLLDISFPLRLVACVHNSHLSIDDKYRALRLSNDLIKVITDTSYILKSSLNARKVEFNVSTQIINPETIISEEMSGQTFTDMRYEYTIVAIDLIAFVEITQECLQETCTALSDCDALLASLTEDEKNSCILPAYDFGDTTVTDNLTPQQETDLIALLCVAGCASVDIRNSDLTYTDNITCAESPFTLPDTTYNINVNGVLRQTVTIPSLKTETINIYP